MVNSPVGALGSSFVGCWSERYRIDDRERELFDVLGPRVAERGYFVMDEFLAVGEWKSRRARKHLAGNDPADVEDLTRMGLAAPPRLKHRVLDLLAGVGPPMASALLTVWNQADFTIIDVRALETLRAHGALADGRTRYVTYLDRCRTIAAEACCSTCDRSVSCGGSTGDRSSTIDSVWRRLLV